MVPVKGLQAEILKFVNDFYAEKRYPAIMRDITKHFAIKSETAIYAITRLAEMGYVDWIVEDNRTRAIFPLWKE